MSKVVIKQRIKTSVLILSIVIISALLCLVKQFADSMKKDYIMWPSFLFKLYLLPLFIFIITGLSLKCMELQKIFKPLCNKISGIFHIVIIVIMLLYIVIMFPFLIYLLRNIIEYFEDIQLAGESSYIPFVPKMFVFITDIVYKHPSVFAVLGYIFWLTGDFNTNSEMKAAAGNDI